MGNFFVIVFVALVVSFNSARAELIAESSTSLELSEHGKGILQEALRRARAVDVTALVDKPTAQILVYRGQQLIGQDVVLIGAKKDDLFPGGSMQASYSLPIPLQEKKVTPAGIFRLWMTLKDPDYGTSLSFAQHLNYRLAIHRYYRGTPNERRLERLLSVDIQVNRITSGCINVRDEFYDQVLASLQLTDNSLLYIVPDDPELVRHLFPF